MIRAWFFLTVISFIASIICLINGAYLSWFVCTLIGLACTYQKGKLELERAQEGTQDF